MATSVRGLFAASQIATRLYYTMFQILFFEMLMPVLDWWSYMSVGVFKYFSVEDFNIVARTIKLSIFYKGQQAYP